MHKFSGSRKKYIVTISCNMFCLVTAAMNWDESRSEALWRWHGWLLRQITTPPLWQMLNARLQPYQIYNAAWLVFHTVMVCVSARVRKLIAQGYSSIKTSRFIAFAINSPIYCFGKLLLAADTEHWHPMASKFKLQLNYQINYHDLMTKPLKDISKLT